MPATRAAAHHGEGLGKPPEPFFAGGFFRPEPFDDRLLVRFLAGAFFVVLLDVDVFDAGFLADVDALPLRVAGFFFDAEDDDEARPFFGALLELREVFLEPSPLEGVEGMGRRVGEGRSSYPEARRVLDAVRALGHPEAEIRGLEEELAGKRESAAATPSRTTSARPRVIRALRVLAP